MRHKALLLASGALAALAAATVLALRRRRLRAKPPAAPKKIAPMYAPAPMYALEVMLQPRKGLLQPRKGHMLVLM